MQRGRCDVKVLLEVLRKQKPHKHTASLTAVNQRNAVLHSNSSILGAGGLAIEYWIDDAGPFFLSY
jgi:hypothetical protein